MSNSEVIKKIVAEELKLHPKLLSDKDGLGCTKGWDSLGHTNIILALEEKLNIEFDFDCLDELTSIKSLVKYIENK